MSFFFLELLLSRKQSFSWISLPCYTLAVNIPVCILFFMMFQSHIVGAHMLKTIASTQNVLLYESSFIRPGSHEFAAFLLVSYEDGK